MSDLERVARAIASVIGPGFDNVHRDKAHWRDTGGFLGGCFINADDPRQDDYLAVAAAAMRETRLIDAEAARKAERQSRKGGMLAGLWKGRADWLQSRAGDENDC